MLKYFLTVATLLLVSCFEDPFGEEESPERISMCAEKTRDGSEILLNLNCMAQSLGTCEDEGRTSLGTYTDYDDCFDDQDYVFSVFQSTNGSSVVPGPLSEEGKNRSGGSGGGGTGETTPYSFTCPSGDTHNVDVPVDQCNSESKTFGKVYGCNLIDQMGSACRAYYSCYGQPTDACP